MVGDEDFGLSTLPNVRRWVLDEHEVFSIIAAGSL